jgi:integrase
VRLKTLKSAEVFRRKGCRMNRHKKDPTYRKHKQSGQAIVTLPDGLGGRRDLLLGTYDSPESWEEYNRVLAEWKANGKRGRFRATSAEPDLTINELLLRFWPHVEQYYRRPDGTQTGEVDSFRLSFKPLKRLYGTTTASNFGPLALKAVRQAMIDGSWLTEEEKAERIKMGKPITCCRNVIINQRIGRIRHMFRWGVENELVPASVLHGLEAVKGLPKGRSAARETSPVKPVPEAFVMATLGQLLPPVAAMVELQLATGMRPGELTVMRGIDIDMTGSIWLYRPGSDQGQEGSHKTAYRGHQRIIAIGPQGQKILRPWLRFNVREYLFSPRDTVRELRAQQRRNRKSKVQPSQIDRKKKNPARKPSDRYTVTSYSQAIARACEKADQKAHQDDPTIPADQVIIPHWHPHQLRHNKATEIRRKYGIDAARVVLGHRSPAITETYAELDSSKAAEIMGKLG